MNEETKEILNTIECWKNGDYVLAYSFNYDKAGNQNNEILNYITNLQEENQKLNKVIEDIDKYIHIFKIEDIGEKTMLILNDILLIKNGLGKDVVRLNKLTELKNEVE